MAGDKFEELHMNEPVDFRKCRIFYMFGIQHPLVEPLGDAMKETLLKAVSHFESTFDLEGVGLDLPFTAYHPEFYSASTEGNIELSRKALSFEGDGGRLNVWKELPKVLTGQSHHTAAVLLITFMESLKKSSEESNEKYLRIRDRLKRQIVETLKDDGLLFFPSRVPHSLSFRKSLIKMSEIAVVKGCGKWWPKPAPFHREPLFAVLNTAYTALFNALALPVVQCPMGLDKNGIPLGVQVHCQ
ncbi:hypothetical protein OSTOST_13798 [Ostertagia ostertagi]